MTVTSKSSMTLFRSIIGDTVRERATVEVREGYCRSERGLRTNLYAFCLQEISSVGWISINYIHSLIMCYSV